MKSSLAIIQVFPNALQHDTAEWPILFYTNNQVSLDTEVQERDKRASDNIMM